MAVPSKSTRSDVAYDLLLRAHPPDLAATYYRDKIAQRPLYLKPTPKNDNENESSSNARALRRNAREVAKLQRRKTPGKPQPLSAKQKRALQIYAVPKEQCRYEIYVPLHALWCGYIREVLGLERREDHSAAPVTFVGKDVRGGAITAAAAAASAKGKGPVNDYGSFVDARSAGPLLASADFHGALVEVVRCRCVGRVGVKGIVVRDTKLTFEVITLENILKVIPKEHTIFRFEIPLENAKQEGIEALHTEGSKALVFELHGSSFEFRAPERATRGMKMRELKPSEINS